MTSLQHHEPLAWVDRTEAEAPDQDRRDARYADLRGADLSGRSLAGMWLQGARLQAADLRGADLRNADLRGADLRQADLRDARFDGADLRHARLHGADLRGTTLANALLIPAQLACAILDPATTSAASAPATKTVKPSVPYAKPAKHRGLPLRYRRLLEDSAPPTSVDEAMEELQQADKEREQRWRNDGDDPFVPACPESDSERCMGECAVCQVGCMNVASRHADLFASQLGDRLSHVAPSLLHSAPSAGYGDFLSLFTHEDLLRRAAEVVDWLPDREQVLARIDGTERPVLRAFDSSYPSRPFSFGQLVLRFSPFWVRSPRTWTRPAGLRAGSLKARNSLLLHVFARYQVPSFLCDAFLHVGEDTNPCHGGQPLLFILLAQGVRPRHAVQALGGTTPAAFWKHLLTLPEALSFEAALAVAWLRALGIDPSMDARVFRYVPSPGSLLRIPPMDAPEAQFARWIGIDAAQFSDDDLESVMDWHRHMETEAERYGRTVLPLYRLTARAALAAAVRYRRELETRGRPYLQWCPSGLGRTYQDGWEFVELLNTRDLARESAQLHHCVVSYAGQCAAKQCRIVGLRRGGAPVVTIELAPSTLEIWQARGACNRRTTSEEQAIIDRWLLDLKASEGNPP